MKSKPDEAPGEAECLPRSVLFPYHAGALIAPGIQKMKSLNEHLAAENIVLQPQDLFVLHAEPDLSRKNKSEARGRSVKISDIKKGAAFDIHGLRQNGFLIYDSIEAAEDAVKQTAKTISSARYAVGIHVARLAPNLILCELWRD